MNHVLLRDIFIAAISRINDIDAETARAVYNDLLRVTDNKEWTSLLRGNYSRKVTGHSKNKNDYESEFLAFIKALGTEDQWLKFKIKAKKFIQKYGALSPDPVVLKYKKDCKWAGLFLLRGRQHFEHEEEEGFLKGSSAKIRDMLNEELRITGMLDLVKLRSIADEDFDDDFKTDGKSEEELKRAS